MAWDDFSDDLESLHKRIHRLMRRMWEPLGEEIESFDGFPVDVNETDDEIIVQADLPGFSKDEISIQATENTLEISAQHKEKKVEKTKESYMIERRMGSFRRFITLPARVNYEKTDAKFENGVLTIAIPKMEKKKVGKEVKIK